MQQNKVNGLQNMVLVVDETNSESGQSPLQLLFHLNSLIFGSITLFTELLTSVTSVTSIELEL